VSREAVLEVEQALGRAGVPEPRTDAELLVAHVLGVRRSTLAGMIRCELDDAKRVRLRSLIDRRRAREPLQYVLGEWGFRRLVLTVDGRALIPRPETEMVVERALAHIDEVDAPRVLDVGTGSGAIALAIADEHPGAQVVALDVSADALSLARENLERTGLADRVELRQGHLLDGLRGPFDLVVSNPPYVRGDELPGLQPEVRDWEPHVALVGEGLTEAIAAGAREVLRPGGGLVLEVAEGSAQRVAGDLRRLGYDDVGVTLDLAGRDRVVEGRAALTSA
jgi:release factor glutamine methyltransferase